MQEENGIPILDGKADQSEISGIVSTNALKTLTEELVKMESAGIEPAEMMEKCVWPILYEASARFRSIAKKDFDIPLDGFEFVVG